MSNQFIASEFSVRPVGLHFRLGVDTVQFIQAPEGASILIIQAEAQTVRYVLSRASVNPSATFGFRLTPTDGERRIDLFQNSTVKVIGEAAGGFVNCQWMRPA
jgi:hypothetical protein